MSDTGPQDPFDPDEPFDMSDHNPFDATGADPNGDPSPFGPMGGIGGIVILSGEVWVHHLYVSGMADWIRIGQMVTTLLISIPVGLLVISLAGTLAGLPAAALEEALRASWKRSAEALASNLAALQQGIALANGLPGERPAPLEGTALPGTPCQ